MSNVNEIKQRKKEDRKQELRRQEKSKDSIGERSHGNTNWNINSKGRRNRCKDGPSI